MSEAEQRLHLEPGAYPFESHFVEAAGARLHYFDEGAGPVLLMLHGNPAWSYLYVRLALLLRNDFRCVAIDLPGFGLSTPPVDFSYEPRDHAQIVAAAIEALDLRGATLIAHDWGGPIGIAATRATGDRITRWRLGNTWAWPVNGDWHFDWFSKLLGGPIGRFAAEKFAVFVNVILPSSMRRRKLTPAELQAFRAPFAGLQSRRGMHVFPRAITGAGGWLAELERYVSEFKGDIALIWPDGDIAFRERELAHWLRLRPEAGVTALKTCGHFLWLEAPEDCAAALRASMLR